MRLITILILMVLSSCGQAMQGCREDLRNFNPNKPLIANILTHTSENLDENIDPIRIELTVRCSAPLLSLPESDIYKVYPIDPVYSLYVPENAEDKFLKFLKMPKVMRDIEIPYIRLYTLDNKNFDCLFLLYVEELKNYFMFGIKKEGKLSTVAPKRFKSAGGSLS